MGLTLDSRIFTVTLLCLLGAGWSGVLLIRELSTGVDRTGDSMAVLEHYSRQVRLKPAKSFIWSNAREGEELYLKDSVQTPSGAGAVIRLHDGNLIELGENSLMMLDRFENLRLSFLKGSMILRGEDGDEKVTVDEAGKRKTEIMPVRLLSPLNLSRIFVAGAEAPIEFKWRLRSRGEKLRVDRIEVSSDARFSSENTIILHLKPQTESVRTSLKVGNYFWRPILREDSTLNSENRFQSAEANRFQVENAEVPRLLFPVRNDQINLLRTDSEIQLRWSALQVEDRGVRHLLELGRDQRFQKVIKAQEVGSRVGSARIHLEDPGDYYWRITSFYPGFQMTSAIEHFQVQKLSGLSLLSRTPGRGSSFELGQPIHLTWQAGAQGLRYEVQIRDGDDRAKASSVLLSTEALMLDWSAKEPGPYQWRVRAFLKDQFLAESEWSDFFVSAGTELKLLSPKNHEQVMVWDQVENLHFQWSENSYVIKYILEVSEDREFKDSRQIESPKAMVDTQASLSSLVRPGLRPGLRPGESSVLHWRVRGLNSKNQLIVQSSRSDFKLGMYPELRAPVLEEPKRGSVINLLELDTLPLLKWATVPEAQSYEVLLKQGSQVRLQRIVRGTRLELRNLQPGQYVFSVRAIDRAHRKSMSIEEREFEVSLGNPLVAPEPLSPEVQ